MVRDLFIATIDDVKIEMKDVASIYFTDKVGTASDQVTFRVRSDFPRPKVGAKIELEFKTYDKADALKEHLKCGYFHVQAVTRTNNKALSFTATGVEFNEKQKEKKSFLFEDTTLKNIVNIVAKRLGHKAKFKTDDLEIVALNQTHETDIEFLKRIADDYNVLFSIKNDFIYFVNKDHISLPKAEIDIDICSSSSIKHSSKAYYKSCETTFYSTDEAKTLTVTVGEGAPVLKITDTYKTEEEAELKAKAKLKQKNKGVITGSLSSRGKKVYAGYKLKVKNTYENEDDGFYSVEECTHNWTRSGGWTTQISIEN